MATSQGTPEQRDSFKEAPVTPSLLDKIVAEGRIAQRDELILKREEFNLKRDIATMFAKSNCFADIDKDPSGAWYPPDVSIARAQMKMEFGASMGFNEGESISGIDIIKGRLAIGAHLRASRMKRAGYSWPSMVCNNKGCWIPLEYQGQPMMHQKFDEATGKFVFDEKGAPVLTQIVIIYTEDDAKKADLFKKDNYQKNPSDMYFARAITRGQRRYAPEVLGVDVLDTHEAEEIADPVSPMATATNAKTEALAEDLKKKRDAKPEPTKAEPKPDAGTNAPVQQSSPQQQTSDPRDASWQERVLTFKAKLGEPEFLAVLHAATGSEDIKSVCFANHEKVWAAMERAVKKDPTPESKPKSGDLF